MALSTSPAETDGTPPGMYRDPESGVWLVPDREPDPRSKARPAKQGTRPRLWKETYSVDKEGYYMTFPFRLISLLPAMPPLQMAAYLYLRREAHNRKLPGYCLVSHPMLAKALGVGERTARWATTELRKAGLVVLARKGSSADGGHANVYRVPAVTTEVMQAAHEYYVKRQPAAVSHGAA